MKHYEKALHIMTKAERDIRKALEPTPAVAEEIATAITRLSSRLSFLSGIAAPATVPRPSYSPVTEFMGEPVGNTSQIDQQYIDPIQSDKAAFRKKVNQLYAQIDTMDPQTVIDSYGTIDRLVVLGVARKAKLDNISGDEELTIDLVETIQDAVRAYESHRKTDATLEAKLKAMAAGNAPEAPETPLENED